MKLHLIADVVVFSFECHVFVSGMMKLHVKSFVMVFRQDAVVFESSEVVSEYSIMALCKY